MKKIAFFIIMVFSLFALSNTIPAQTDSEYDTALEYYNSGRYEEAVMLFKDYIKERPDPSAYYRIAYGLYKLKKFDEATRYFEDAYLIDPTFSPVPVEWVQQYRKGKAGRTTEPSVEQAPSEQLPPVSETTIEPPALREEAAPETQPAEEAQVVEETQPPEATQPQEIQDPVVTPKETWTLPETQEVEPQGAMQLPERVPIFPGPRGDMPVTPPAVLTGLMAGFTVLSFLIDLAVYIFFCLCLFLIAKKLDVRAAWTAWIPIVNIWTIVASAGKPWWWILLLLIPIVNFFIAIYLWMCITEHLGKNKWLGLLMLLPIVNFVFLGVLAFSKGEKFGYHEEATTA